MPLNLQSIGKKIGPITREYNWKDAVLYALGVGAGFDDLDYCYEDRLKIIPSFATAMVFEFFANVSAESNANLAGILHGEQDIIYYNPFPVEGTLTTEGAIENIYDMGADKGALVVARADTYHSNGDKLFTNIFRLFCRLDGGFGGEKPEKELVDFPDREPDFVDKTTPSADQPLLYRLSGDVFALHVNPDFAKASGFDSPIMHGLCTHGFTCRALIKSLFPGQPERMSRYATRFSKPLYPGQPIETRIWKIEEGHAVFRVVNSQTGDVVIDNGIVEWLTPDQMKDREKKKGIRFDGRVAIVTGAGAGLGRAYALELAKRGAKVVINDLGGARDGTGSSSSVTDKVVAEIKAFGGEAVPNYDSVATVEGGQAIVQSALDAFGKLDILINNAGILRDKTFVKMEPAQWQAVMDVHLNAAYNVTRPAFLAMRENNYGRIVMTTSAAGLYGNFGQTNYSAAKLALVGFANSLKLEGERNNIKVNVVAPIAATRLTDDILPPDMKEKLKPEFVAPMVLLLSSDKCPATGNIYNAGMGYFNRVAIVSGKGAIVGSGQNIPEPEDVLANMDAILSTDSPKEFPHLNAAMMDMMTVFSKPAEEKAPEKKGGSISAGEIIDKMPDAFQKAKAEGVEVVFQFDLSGTGGGTWHAAIKDQTCTVAKGPHEKPTTTILMSAEDFVGLISGKVNAMQAYSSGKLKIEGDLMKSQLIEKLFKF